jgi:hypothetical protein
MSIPAQFRCLFGGSGAGGIIAVPAVDDNATLPLNAVHDQRARFVTHLLDGSG